MSDAPITTADSLPWRFSIRTLLIVVTVVCALSAPYPWLGGGYLVAIAFSAALIGICVRARHTTGIGAAAGLALIGIIAGFGGLIVELMLTNGLSGATFTAAITNLIACILCIPFKPRTSVFAGVLCLAGLVPYAMVIQHRLERHRKLAELVKKHPLESLETRLSFEPVTTSEKGSSPPRLNQIVNAALINFEQQLQPNYASRHWALEQLHDETYQRFRFAEDFGVMRMGYVSEYSLAPPEREITSLPIKLRIDSNPLRPSDLEEVHKESLFDSFNPDGFGYIRNRDEIAGFEPHGPVDLDRRLENLSSKQDIPALELTRLELVSLLRHDEPRVYVAETIPLMNELEDIPHRALNEFEAGVLSQLQTQRDTVIQETPDGAVMLGAVRAGNDCLQCHNGPRGKLLGAFSYEFRDLKP